MKPQSSSLLLIVGMGGRNLLSVLASLAQLRAATVFMNVLPLDKSLLW